MYKLMCQFHLKGNAKRVIPRYILRQSSSTCFKPYYENFFKFSENLAVVDNRGCFKYKDIIQSSYLVAKRIKTLFPNSKEKSERISFLCSSDATYVSVLLACWVTGNIAVPLCSSHPESLLSYYIEDSQSKLVISNAKYQNTIQNIISKSNTSFFTVDHDIFSSTSSSELESSEFFSWDNSYQDRDALIIYTSGTTGRPKGVVLKHGTLHSQTYAVIKMWEISDQDSILHSLPLHHIHGIMNALLCPLKCGGTVVMQQKFNTTDAWKHFMALEDKPRVNIYFAVPTMYAKLVQEFEKLGEGVSSARKRCQQNMRVFCSGSASLPIPVYEGFEDITGHRIVERFGMSEVGMALSNTLNGPRTPGTVGVPLPEVEVKLRKLDEESQGYTDVVIGNENSVTSLTGKDGEYGELLVKGPAVFKEYWNKEKATVEAFTEDGWFLTGDTVSYKEGAFRILGRTSVDIIKSGGFKISALEVESCLLAHPEISECTVFGLPDDVWGERVTAVIMLKKGKTLEDVEIKEWCKKFIPPYAAPTVIKRVDTIPRNVIGKVNKKELRTQFTT